MSAAPSEEGRRLATALDAVTRVHRDVAALLETSVGMMQEAGFEIATDAGSMVDLSTAIYRPRDWMPHEVHRYMVSDKRPQVLVALVVFLTNREDKEARRFDEPLVATTWFRFETSAGKYNGKDWKLWYSRWHVWLGAVAHADWARRNVEDYPQKERDEWEYRFRELSSRAIPLASVRDAESLRAQVIAPLLADLPTPQRGGSAPSEPLTIP
ncbi:MAG TPA: hypothetical protein VII08_10695 [Myxococcales bacterium]